MRPSRQNGSRYLYDSFDANAARIDTHEKVIAERWNALERRLSMIEDSLERLERRLWLALYGVVAFILTRGILTILELSKTL